MVSVGLSECLEAGWPCVSLHACIFEGVRYTACVQVTVCVCGRRVNTHTLHCLSAFCENMVAWDKSSKTHPSRGPNTPCAAVDTGLTT